MSRARIWLLVLLGALGLCWRRTSAFVLQPAAGSVFANTAWSRGDLCRAGSDLPLAGGRRDAGWGKCVRGKAPEFRYGLHRQSASPVMVADLDHASSFVQLADASNLLLAPEILGEVSLRSSEHEHAACRRLNPRSHRTAGHQLGRAYVNFLHQEAQDPQQALEHFRQWELDRFRSFEFFILVPLYACLCLEPRYERARAVRTHWATLGLYATVFGLLGGQFGLYFYDIFEVLASVPISRCELWRVCAIGRGEGCGGVGNIRLHPHTCTP